MFRGSTIYIYLLAISSSSRQMLPGLINSMTSPGKSDTSCTISLVGTRIAISWKYQLSPTWSIMPEYVLLYYCINWFKSGTNQNIFKQFLLYLNIIITTTNFIVSNLQLLSKLSNTLILNRSAATLQLKFMRMEMRIYNYN